MKKQTLMTAGATFRKTILSLTLASTFLFALPAIAQQRGDSPISVRYIGNIDNQPVYQLELDNESGLNLTISIQDSDGNVLYLQRASDRKFIQRFRLDRSISEDIELSVQVSSGRQKWKQDFAITVESRTVRDVVVTRLNP